MSSNGSSALERARAFMETRRPIDTSEQLALIREAALGMPRDAHGNLAAGPDARDQQIAKTFMNIFGTAGLRPPPPPPGREIQAADEAVAVCRVAYGDGLDATLRAVLALDALTGWGAFVLAGGARHVHLGPSRQQPPPNRGDVLRLTAAAEDAIRVEDRLREDLERAMADALRLRLAAQEGRAAANVEYHHGAEAVEADRRDAERAR